MENNGKNREEVKREVISEFTTKAQSQVGYIEKHNARNLNDFTANAGSGNFTRYAADHFPYVQGKAWCDTFVDAMAIETFGRQDASKILGGFSAGTVRSVELYKEMGRWHNAVTIPEVGDQVFFKFPGNNNFVNHTGIVVGVDLEKGTIRTVEGNTSNGRNNRDGGGVYEKERSLSDPTIRGYGRPNWDIIIDKRLIEVTPNKGHNPKSQLSEEELDFFRQFRNDKDGSFASKMLAENPQVMAGIEERVQERSQRDMQQQQADREMQEMAQQQARDYGGRSFG